VTADKGYDAKRLFAFVGDDLGAVPVIDVRRPASTRAREARPCEAEPVITSTGLHYRCNRLPYDAVCPEFGTCPILPVFADGPLSDVGARYFEKHSPFPYGSKEWKAVYNKRVSVERVFSRLKGYRKLNSIRTRRLPKVWLHVALSVLTMNVAALMRDSASLRRCLA
jgi:transposase